jgi:succinate-acetate transporter protein
MSTIDERRERASAGVPLHDDYWQDGFARPRVFLQPIAAPSILGLYGFGVATFMVAANIAGWYGNAKTGLYLAPFAATAGGLAQFLAGMWSYRARDALATAMHGIWGAFWIGYGILNLLFATHTLVAPSPVYASSDIGFWFFALALVTASGALASLAESIGLFAVLSTLACGSGILAGAYIVGSHGWFTVAGWVLVFSAGFAWYTATAMMLAATYGRTIVPLGKWSKAANVPTRAPMRPIELEWAEPGVKMGQ